LLKIIIIIIIIIQRGGKGGGRTRIWIRQGTYGSDWTVSFYLYKALNETLQYIYST